MFLLNLQREKGRKRETAKHCLATSHMPLTGDPTCSFVCPLIESPTHNLLVQRAMPQPTEPASLALTPCPHAPSTLLHPALCSRTLRCPETPTVTLSSLCRPVGPLTAGGRDVGVFSALVFSLGGHLKVAISLNGQSLLSSWLTLGDSSTSRSRHPLRASVLWGLWGWSTPPLLLAQ